MLVMPANVTPPVPQANAAVPSRIETQVLRVRELVQEQQFLPALAAAQALPAEVPENRHVLRHTEWS
jgi:hypothetical protein